MSTNAIVIIATALLALVGAGVAIWSIISIRQRHIDDYKRRKGRE